MTLVRDAEIALDRGVPAAGHQRRHQSRPRRPAPASSITCTCTSCRAGTATPTSCPSSAKRRVLPEELAAQRGAAAADLRAPRERAFARAPLSRSPEDTKRYCAEISSCSSWLRDEHDPRSHAGTGRVQGRRRAVRARGGGAARRGDRRERRVSVDVIRAAAGLGLLGVTMSTAWGGAGRDYVSYALAIEAIARASATVAASLVGHQLARGGAGRARGPRRAERAVAAARWRRRDDRRLRAVGADGGHRRRESEDDRRRGPATATGSPAGRSGSRTPMPPAWSSCSPRRSRAGAARASRRFSCRWTRRASRARRAPIRWASAVWAAWISIST